jgi:transketolase
MVSTLSPAPREIRRIILGQSKRANVGHIGSCLSIVEILSALFGGVLRATGSGDTERDRFVLSKGHAALALYAVLRLQGKVSETQMDTFCGDGSLLGVHPESALPGVDFSTGSLGQGITMAVGSALGARLQGSGRRTFCVISDGECNEGSVWEAAMFAGHHQLSNLVVIADMNGQQALDLTANVSRSDQMAERWEAFGWRVSNVDGHSIEQLTTALESPGDRPHCILARTIFGRGVDFMEKGIPITQTHLPVQAVNWHYLPMSDAEYDIAMRNLEGV